MPNKKSKCVCPWEKDKKAAMASHALAVKLFAFGDTFTQAACEVVLYAKDGRSRKRLDLLTKAIEYHQTIRQLFAVLDPKHFNWEVHHEN